MKNQIESLRKWSVDVGIQKANTVIEDSKEIVTKHRFVQQVESKEAEV